MNIRWIAFVLVASTLAPSSSAQCAQWSALGSPGDGMNASVDALTVFDSGSGPQLYAGGSFDSAGGAAVAHIARWDGTSWSALSSATGTNGSVLALCVFDDGDGAALYAGGSFTMIEGVPANRIARWDGTSWSALGNGANATVNTLAVFNPGTGPALIVGGEFTNADALVANRIARWDGSSWSLLGTGMNFGVRALCVVGNGVGSQLFAGGAFTNAGGGSASHVARWDGTSWFQLGTGASSNVHALAVFHDGANLGVFAGGDFLVAGSQLTTHIGKWNGASWETLGSGVNDTVRALSVFDDGSGAALYAGGEFTAAGGSPAARIARWNGTSWSPFSSGLDSFVRALEVYDDGAGPDLIAGGIFTFAGSGDALRIARWHGCARSSLASFCAGDGSLATACPCANTGDAGHGCGNSVHTGGALLSATGTTDPDTVDFQLADVPPGVTTIYLQGDASLAGGAVFGDGVRCAGGSLLRLGAKADIDLDGTTAFGPSSGNAQVSIIGGVVPGGTYSYQVYYRNPAASWCPPATFNISNGMRIVWFM